MDAPDAAIRLAYWLAGAVVGAFVGFLLHLTWLLVIASIFGVWCVVTLASFMYTTRVGKLQEWASLLDQSALRGDERVLDVGCGRGAVMHLAAAMVPRGKVVGIDLWSNEDQSGNNEATTRRNAELEGVADRIDVQTGDMCELPFPDRSFDLVVSSLAIHNVRDTAARNKAIDEILRVLKPGGRVIIADIKHTVDYAARMRERGATDVLQRKLSWRFWYGGPYGATGVVTARSAT